MCELAIGKDQVIDLIFKQYDTNNTEELNLVQLQALHATLRMGGISIQQVKASVDYVCVTSACEKSELLDLLQEMDRRYYLVQDFRWEFSLLDREQINTITEDQSLWFVQSVHGKYFSRRKWEQFLRQRAVPGSGVSFAEIEVELCNIPSKHDIAAEDEEAKLAAEEKLRKQQEAEERRRKKFEEEKQRRIDEERKRLEDEERRKQDELKRKEDEEKRHQHQLEVDEAKRKNSEEEDENERKRKQDEERERKRKEEEDRKKEEKEMLQKEEKLKQESEEKRKREEEEAKDAKTVSEQAEQMEKEAEEELKKAQKALKDANDAKSKKEAEEMERRAKEKAKENKEKKIRANLKVAIKSRDKGKLDKGIKDFKDAKLKDTDMDVETAEKILKQLNAKDGLKKAMTKREIQELERAITFVKKNGYEVDLAPEMLEANKLLLNLRRLERIRAEILELKQSTVAEIRSYQTPPPAVHTVMTATFLMLGHQEKETKVWKTVQALVGKTGKEGLKRRCLELEPSKVDLKLGKKAKELFSKYELDEIRDVSAGAATFYVWGTTMCEEADAIAEAKKAEAEEKKAAADASKET